MKKFIILYLLSLAILSCNKEKVKILIFSKTTGYRHQSINDGKIALLKLAKINDIFADTSENSTDFTLNNLQKYKAVIFLNTSGDILNNDQKSAFEQYIRLGNGFVGIHSASNTEFDWPWFVKLVGANFESHPDIQEANIIIKNHDHLSTKTLPNVWRKKDEWYNFKNLNNTTTTLLTVDEKSYNGGKNGDSHPISWFHQYDGGRSFYTALGHTNESYSDSLFLKHIKGGIEYAIGKKLK